MPNTEEQTMAPVEATPVSGPLQTPEKTDKKASKQGKHQKPKKKKKRGKKVVLFVVILLLLGGAAFGIYTLFFNNDSDAVAITDLTTYGSLDRAIEGSGTTVPLESQAVTLASYAEIEDVYVAEGDYVEPGQILYTQDDSEIDDTISDLNDSIDSYKDEIIEYEESITDNTDSIDDYNENIADYNEEISDLYEEMTGLTIYAPYSGRITEVNVEEDDTVGTSTSLAVITDDSTLELTQYFSYSYLDMVYEGMPAVLSVADQMLIMDATVSEIDLVHRISGDGMDCFGVTVTVENPGSLTEDISAACYLTAADGTKVYPAIEGTLEYAGSTTIIPEVSGTLEQVNVVDYQTVKKGDLLFAISSDTYDDELENLQKQIENAEKQITQAQSQIETYQERIDTNNEKIAETEEQIADAEASRADYAVTADIAGKVMYVNVEPGTEPNRMISSAVTIYNLDTMTISVNIDELDVDYLYEGMTVTVYRTSAETMTPYVGTITYISPEATSTDGVATFPATIEIPSEGALSAGVNVTYSVNVGDTEKSVLAPVSALKATEQGNCLFVKADKAPDNAITLAADDVEVPKGFYAVPVEVGSSNSYYIRILSGVEQDTEVFLRYQQTAPSGGDTTSESQESEAVTSFMMPGQGGQMPGQGGFSGGGGGGPQS